MSYDNSSMNYQNYSLLKRNKKLILHIEPLLSFYAFGSTRRSLENGVVASLPENFGRDVHMQVF